MGAPPIEPLIAFEQASASWPVQVKQMYGQMTPQDAWTLPCGHGPLGMARAKPEPQDPALARIDDHSWRLGAFRLQAAPKVAMDGVSLSKAGMADQDWYRATVPGTVLTTLVDRGVYPDPDFGLNNLAIPESLARQSYWYRAEFDTPADLDGRHLTLLFNGINYAAEIWLNGQRLGEIRGAFQRGQFDIGALVRSGARNALAIKVSPPPHPGIAHEQSISAGVGENGGIQAIDGPTFIASEGWDWIPAVRDRNTGLWQDVQLLASGAARIGDVQVITALPKSDRSEADLTLIVPIDNSLDHAVNAKIGAAFDAVALTKTVTLPSGHSEIRLSPAEFAELKIKSPKLWWPNGLGEASLHGLKLSLDIDGQSSDRKELRFGMREISYELSLLDGKGHLRRVAYAPSRDLGRLVVDGRHEAIRKIAGGWVQSIAAGQEGSQALTALPETSLTPYMVLRVNGVRVAARGGSWGTDDWRKRVSRERLEPFFKLHKAAHVNIIRNWVGQNTEEAFYDLADEYGLLVLNDFWASTQDYNIEPQDVPLFLANAADVIRRYRHHPSIALWFGRNEGVPQPVLNEGLAGLVRDLDGTRHYMGSSNRVNLQDSGPYDYREPESYFTTHSKGFAVEVGTPSFPTAEAFRAAVAPEDLWPINDVWAYHDWHQTGNGATAKFMAALDRKLGEAKDFDDFERKAQLLNYESHRAIFEGMNAELWQKTSGRMLWMTQPAWPSTNWQILSSDYDTHGSFYGVQKAAEIIHIQMDLPGHGVTLVNNSLDPLKNLVATARILDLAGHQLAERHFKADLPAGSVAHLGSLALGDLLKGHPVLLISLQLRQGDAVLSDNFYWQGADDGALRALSAMATQTVEIQAQSRQQGADRLVTVTLRNRGTVPALLTKLTLQHQDGSRVLPAIADSNYVSLLPGESRMVEIVAPAADPDQSWQVGLRGWNVVSGQVDVAR
jgi:beta-galactosidase/beta-glucuronidase